MSKQDRQGVRTPADLERKYDLGRMSQNERDISAQLEQMNRLNQSVQQFVTYTNAKLSELEEQVESIGGVTSTDFEALSDKVTDAEQDISALETAVDNEPTLYQGANLTTKHAAEITAHSNVWAWIKSRITLNNFAGIRVGDYIPFTANGVTMNAQVAGIDTYYNYGDTAVRHHIDFICKELWPTAKAMNKADKNNGVSGNEHPWLASDLYLYLNSLSGTVQNSSGTESVDYTLDGIYSKLPAALKSVIVEKRMLLEKRYDASENLISGNDWAWANIGKLWCPTETEVFGMSVWGDFGYSSAASVQYPIFRNNMNRVKLKSGNRETWWLLTPSVGYAEYWCAVHFCGFATDYGASAEFAAPVCFRIA